MSSVNNSGTAVNPVTSVTSVRARPRPVSMFLKGNIDFSRYTPETAPKSTRQILAARIQNDAQSDTSVAEGDQTSAQQVRLSHHTLQRPRSSGRRLPTKGLSSQVSSATAQSNSSDRSDSPDSLEGSQALAEEVNADPIAPNLGKLLIRHIKNALAPYCKYEDKPKEFKFLKILLEPFFTHTGYIPGTEGFSEGFIREVAFHVGILPQNHKPDDDSRYAFVSYYELVESIIKSESDRLIVTLNSDGTQPDRVEKILAFATDTYKEVYEHFSKKFEKMDTATFDALFTMVIIKKAEERGLLKRRELSNQSLKGVRQNDNRNDDDDNDAAEGKLETSVSRAAEECNNQYGPAPRVPGIEESSSFTVPAAPASNAESERNAFLLKELEKLQARNKELENEVKDLRGRLFTIASMASVK